MLFVEWSVKVELARLKYDLSHVVRSGEHYDQQAGGFGIMAGGQPTHIRLDFSHQCASMFFVSHINVLDVVSQGVAWPS